MNKTLWLVDLGSGEGRDLTPDLDLWPQHPVWSPDSSAVLFTADRLGAVALFRIDVGSTETTLLSSQDALSDICPTPDGKTVYAIRSSYAQPPHVVRLDASAPNRRQRLFGHSLSSTTRSCPAASSGSPPPRRMAPPSRHGWCCRVTPTRRIPRRSSSGCTAARSHRGTPGAGAGIRICWSARGYAVLLPDPGSHRLRAGADRPRLGPLGRGAVHGRDRRHGCGVEAADLDASRTAPMGGSFGGYMANWVAGQHRPLQGDRHPRLACGSCAASTAPPISAPSGSVSSAIRTTTHARYEAASPHRLVGNIRRRCWSSMASATTVCRSARRSALDGPLASRRRGQVPLLPR